MTYESCVKRTATSDPPWFSFDFSATQDVGYTNKLSQVILGCEFAAYSLLPMSDVFI